MQNRGILITLRAAAIVIIVTGLNDVIASAVPRYEPLYLYLAAVALVALTDGVVLGIGAAILAIAFYALLFMPRAQALSPAIIVPAAAALGVAIVGAVIRGLVRPRRRQPEPSFSQMPPLLETSAVAQVTDNAEVLAAIDELRNELRTAIADLSVARDREGEQADRIRQFENDRDWALKVADESRVRADRERGLRTVAESELAEAREEAATMAGRLAELELSMHESERAGAEAAELMNVLEKLRRELNESRAAQRQSLSDVSAAQGKVVELELSLREAEKARAEAEKLRRELAELRNLQTLSETGTAATERLLADARQESATMAGRVAELELSLREAEKVRAEAEKLRRELAELRNRQTVSETGAAATERLLADARQESATMAGRVAELELSLRETEKLRDEVGRLRSQLTEAERLLVEERTTRQRLEEEVQNFDKKLQTIVTHLASDHETDLGQAMSEKEEARAEARALAMKLSVLQKKHDEDTVKLREAEALLAETRSAAPVPATRPRVMIVHPDADLRATASASLERAGYEVVTAADGLEALRVAIARQPDVVIAETSMPKMDGRELCQLLKSQAKTSHIRVVLLMRAGDEAPRGDLPPDEILRKPVPVETLKATLASLLARV